MQHGPPPRRSDGDSDHSIRSSLHSRSFQSSTRGQSPDHLKNACSPPIEVAHSCRKIGTLLRTSAGMPPHEHLQFLPNFGNVALTIPSSDRLSYSTFW